MAASRWRSIGCFSAPARFYLLEAWRRQFTSANRCRAAWPSRAAGPCRWPGWECRARPGSPRPLRSGGGDVDCDDGGHDAACARPHAPALSPVASRTADGFPECTNSAGRCRILSVWAILGTVVYPIGLIVTNAEMRWLVLARLV